MSARRACVGIAAIVGCAAAPAPRVESASPTTAEAAPCAAAAPVATPTAPTRSPAEEIALWLREPGVIVLREAERCRTFEVEPAPAPGRALLEHHEGRRIQRVAVEWDGTTLAVRAPSVDDEHGICRTTLTLLAGDARAIRFDRGPLYADVGACVQGAVDRDPPIDLGSCGQVLALLLSDWVEPPAEGDPLQARIDARATFFELLDDRGELRCQPWTFVSSTSIERREPAGVAERRFQYARGRMTLGATSFRGTDGSLVALGGFHRHLVRFVDSRYALVGGAPWFFDAADCEAARERGGLPASAVESGS